jgi:hypothetical protein
MCVRVNILCACLRCFCKRQRELDFGLLCHCCTLLRGLGSLKRLRSSNVWQKSNKSVKVRAPVSSRLSAAAAQVSCAANTCTNQACHCKRQRELDLGLLCHCCTLLGSLSSLKCLHSSTHGKKATIM